MSLTSHLTSSRSPVRQFVYASAPELAIAGTSGSDGKAMASFFGFDELTALEAQIPIPNAVKDRTGHAGNRSRRRQIGPTGLVHG